MSDRRVRGPVIAGIAALLVAVSAGVSAGSVGPATSAGSVGPATPAGSVGPATPAGSVGPALAGRTAGAPEVPRLEWTRCAGVYECATARVPLDYDRPEGERIELALIRRPADDREHRIGSLFVHPGGPGNAITDPVFFAPMVAGLGDEVRSRFDIVGIDPRGTGGSTPATCRAAPDTPAVPVPADTYPSTDEQYDRRFAYDAYVRKSCAATAGPILDHMSTADSARDLDLIRRSVGDRKLSFYGLSYGAILGQTYAAMFPDRVRAIAVDGVFDAERWAVGELPPFGRTASGQGTAEAVNAALDRCDKAGVIRCPFAGESRTRWQRLRKSLARKPIEVGGVRLNDKAFADYTEAAVQLDHLSGVPVSTIEPWMGALRLIELAQAGRAGVDGGRIASVVRHLDARIAAGNRTGDEDEGTDDSTGDDPGDSSGGGTVGAGSRLGAWCADTENPADPRTWIEAGQNADASAPGFGPAHVWATSACATWPGSASDAFRGPFDVTTSTPLLMIGLTHDSTTPIAGVYAAAQHVPGSRVVEVRSWGHTALGKSNRCLRPLTNAYLLRGRLPASDRICRPDHELYR